MSPNKAVLAPTNTLNLLALCLTAVLLVAKTATKVGVYPVLSTRLGFWKKEIVFAKILSST